MNIWETKIVNSEDKAFRIRHLNFINLFYAEIYEQETGQFGNPETRNITFRACVSGPDKKNEIVKDFLDLGEAFDWCENSIKGNCRILVGMAEGKYEFGRELKKDPFDDQSVS